MLVLDRQVMVKRIGAGGYGDVFKALYSHSFVAVKRFKVLQSAGGSELGHGHGHGQGRSLEVPAAIVTELEIATRLRHPNIVQYLGLMVDVAALDLGLVMELASCSAFEYCVQGQRDRSPQVRGIGCVGRTGV